MKTTPILITILLLTTLTFAKSQTITGDFRYMADAPLFIHCETGRSYPVSQEKGYLKLERAYREKVTEAGAPVAVVLKGFFTTRPAMEGDGLDSVLVVKKIKSITSTPQCAQPKASLFESTWQLSTLKGEEVNIAEDKTQITLELTKDGRVQGRDGCNGYSGKYTLAEEKLSFDFSGMMSTMMFCSNLNGLDKKYTKALTEVTRYEVSASRLLFLDDSGAIIMIFERK